MSSRRSGAAVGIHLGTAKSQVALLRDGRPQPIADPLTGRAIVPSLVALDPEGRILVGESAMATVDLPGRGVREVKRLMGTNATVALGDEEYRPEEVSAIILTHLRRMAESYVGEPVTAAVISVPANFGEAARTATYNAARVAGLEVLRLVNEPTAAALAFGQQSLEAEGQIVVFDWGGGTLDVTTLEMMEGVLDIRSSFGDPHLGGKDFDDKMIDLLLQKFAAAGGDCSKQFDPRRTLERAAETAVKDLTVSTSASVYVNLFGHKAGEIADLEATVTREEFEAAARDLLDRARVVVNRALKAGKFRPSSIHKVLLVGGTTYIPAVRQLVAELFGIEGSTEVDPDLAVVMGAAIQASIATDQAGEWAPVFGQIMGTAQLEDGAKRIEALMGGGRGVAPIPATPVAPVSDSPLRRKYESLLKRASKLMDSGKKPSQTGRLARAIEVLETAIQSGDPARCESAGGALVDAVFEYEVD